MNGSKIHADASKSKAVSYKRLLAIEAYLKAEVAVLFPTAHTVPILIASAQVRIKAIKKRR